MDRAPEPFGRNDGSADLSLMVERLAAVAHAAATADGDAVAAVRMLVHQTAVAYRASGGLLALVDEAGTPVPLVIHGNPDAPTGSSSLPLEWLLPLAAAALSGEPLFLEDRYDGVARFPEWDTFQATAAAAALPLVWHGRVIGATAFVFDVPMPFGELARQYLRLVADLCAVSLGGASSEGAAPVASSETRWLIDSTDSEIALLDRDGVIVAVNEAWLEFGRRNGADPARCGVGMSYLAVCDAASGQVGAALIGAAIRAALAGAPMAGPVSIPCHDPREDRWYEVMVSTRWCDDRPGAVEGATVVLTRAFPVSGEG